MPPPTSRPAPPPAPSGAPASNAPKPTRRGVVFVAGGGLFEHPYDRLPFVVPGNNGSGRRFWVPPVTGEYGVDCDLGEMYAERALPFLREPEAGRQLLRWIVLDMLKHGDAERDCGVIVGFMGRVGAELEGV